MLMYIQAIILGIVEGVTEFLPISSTGHMIIVDTFIHFDKSFREMFLIVIQLGAILSVLIYFRDKLFPLGALRDRAEFRRMFNIWLKAAVGVVPSLIVGGLFGKIIQRALFNVTTVAVALLIGGIALILIERRKCKVVATDMETLSYPRAFMIGCAQCLAMIPGTSRSAATILGGMMLGTSREVAVEYSFFLAIPTMMAASAYSLMKDGAALTRPQWIATGIGFLVSFLVAWGVIAFFMNYIRKRDFKLFGWYRIALGIVLLIYFGIGK
ncbi:MAG: undecaprenyl-diphosphate phosphatase [Victivallaceae bacterium]